MKTLSDKLGYFSQRANVRYALQPDNPALLYNYLQQNCMLADSHASRQVKRRFHRQAVRLLLDTLCDDCIDLHWRHLCLDQIHQPLLALQSLARSDHERRQDSHLICELRLLSHYFLSGA
ncbi:hypothetical protein [Bowmanella denitrificans]|uniref:hypothetical protein n=1 Tax=Bowmanella denitrificans TaxID=366582 RepID=UPI000C99ACAB|nr:hypothetical protein [Bowmanella denitrificans]